MFPPGFAGGRDCQEFWIPDEDFHEVHLNIVGSRAITAEYR